MATYKVSCLYLIRLKKFVKYFYKKKKRYWHYYLPLYTQAINLSLYIHVALHVSCVIMGTFDTFFISYLNLFARPTFCIFPFFNIQIGAVDLPEFKGKHRKFRNLVSSYIGKCLVSNDLAFISFNAHSP